MQLAARKRVAYSDEISEEALTKACKAARGIAPSGGHNKLLRLGKTMQARYSENNPILAMQDAEKISLLKQ